jgi:dienelactone hydrolase
LKGFSDPTAADIFEFNLKMNTTAESVIYRYSEQSHGFLNDEANSIELRKKHGFISKEEAKTVYTTEKEIRDLVWSRIVNFLVDQLSHHQQSANL